MTVFDRKLPQVAFNQLQNCAEELPWFRDLLRRWQPAGDALEYSSGGPVSKHLRLAIRDGYLNFYRLGQSVARVGFSQTGVPEARIHNKYVDDSVGDQSYVLLKGGRLSSAKGDDFGPYTGPGQLDGWIEEAEEYSGREKCFVDEVVARNANVIDLEMGLPAIGDAKTAPRMDIVALEKGKDGWQVVFWEAKLMGDGRLRRSGEQLPEVVAQLDAYMRWMAHPGNTERVSKAYQETCRLFVKFHALAQSVGAELSQLGDGITAVATASEPPKIDVRPRLIIEDRVPNATWKPNGHHAKLESHGVAMQIVGADSDLELGLCA